MKRGGLRDIPPGGPRQPPSPMNPPDLTTLNPGPATLFQLAARLEVPAGAGREKPAPAITASSFAKLRREAGSSPLSTAPVDRRTAGDGGGASPLLDKVRLAAFTRLFLGARNLNQGKENYEYQ